MQKNHEFEKILNSLGIEDYMPRAKGRITVAESSKRQADGSFRRSNSKNEQ
jgi:hypothetical protein